jgi:hypothetical protein
MKLKSEFAILDVMHGRRQLDKLIDKAGNGHDLPERIPVVIHGWITGRWGSDDGISQEFNVKVDSVEVVK